MGHVASCTLELWRPPSPFSTGCLPAQKVLPAHSSEPRVQGSLFGEALLSPVCLAPAVPGPPAGSRDLGVAEAALLASPQPPSHPPHCSDSLSNCGFVSNYCLHNKHRHTRREGKYTVSHCGRLSCPPAEGLPACPTPTAGRSPRATGKGAQEAEKVLGWKPPPGVLGCGPALMARKDAHRSPCRLPCLAHGPAVPCPRALAAHPGRPLELGEEFTRPGGPAQQAICRGRAASLRGAGLVPVHLGPLHSGS